MTPTPKQRAAFRAAQAASICALAAAEFGLTAEQVPAFAAHLERQRLRIRGGCDPRAQLAAIKRSLNIKKGH